MTRKIVAQQDEHCAECDHELPAGSRVVVDEELDLIFCDDFCENNYFSRESDLL